MQSAVCEIRQLGLKDVHVGASRHTRFWYFVEAALYMDADEYGRYKEPDSLIVDMMERAARRLNQNVDGFDIGGRIVCPRRTDLKLIFGIRDGEIPIHIGGGGVEFLFIDRCWPVRPKHTFLLSSCVILDVLKAKVRRHVTDPNVVEDVARLVHMFL